MVHVVSCRFLRLGCSHTHLLFEGESTSTSSNQVQCLPHCDPKGCCRCWIHVLVTFSDDMSEVPLDDLVMCTHFEPSRLDHVDATTDHMFEMDPSLKGGHKFRVGEIVFLPETVMSGDMGDASWSRPSRVSDAKLQHLSKSSQRRTVLFLVNRKKNFGEMWSSDGSDARTQDGHLVTTIFLLRDATRRSVRLDSSMKSKECVSGFSAVVLWRQVSTLGPLDGSHSENRFEFSFTPRNPTGYDDSTTNGASPFNFAATEQKLGDFKFASTSHRSEENNIDEYDTNTSVADTDSDILDISDDTELWQHTSHAREIDFRGKTQRLLILWIFFTEIQLNDIAVIVDCIETHFRSHLQQAAAVFRKLPGRSCIQLEDIVTSFLSGIFDHDFVTSPCAGFHDNIGAKVSSVLAIPTIQVAVHLVLRAFSSRPVAQILHSALCVGKDATSKVQLQEVFVSLVADLYDAIGAILCEVVSDNDASLLLGDPTVSLSGLIDDVLSLVYGQKRFAVLQPEMLAILRCQQSPNILTKALNDAFQMFVAQVREIMISSGVQPKNIQQLCIHNGPIISHGNLLLNGCNYRWMLEPASVQVHDIASRDMLSSIKLASIAQFVREFSCIEMDIKRNAASLSLQSLFTLSHNASMSPTKLVLDSRHRVFRVLPSGLSSMIKTVEGWFIGDYVGSLSDDGQSVDVDFFTYKEDADTPLDTRPKVSPTSGFTTDNKAAVVRRVSVSITLEEKQGYTCSSTPLDGEYYPSNIFAFVDGMVSDSPYRQDLAGNYKLSEMASAERGELWKTLDWIPLMEIRAGYIALCGAR